MNVADLPAVDAPRAHALRLRALLLIAVVALAALLLADRAGAANPSIINTGTGCSGQTSWLVSCATAGETNKNGNILRISALVAHDTNRSLASIITDDDWDSTSDPSTVRNVTADRPNIVSGYPRSRVEMSYTLPTSNTGMGCNPIGNRDRRTERTARIQARDNGGQTSGTTSSMIKFVAAGQCTGFEDYAFLFSWGSGNFGKEATPGQSVSFTYTGDDPDTTGNSDFQGINWRWRNLRSGSLSGETLSCPGGGDNESKTLSTNAPSTRGAYVLEAELRTGGGCSQDQNPNHWFPIGTVDVNSSSIPAPGLSATRPQVNGETTITLDPPNDPDSANGGGVQIIEWDLDQNTGNGVNGYETTTVAGEGSRITANQTKTIDTTGMSPGVYTVRARITDNGAMDAADSIRKQATASTTFTVNSPPALTAPASISTEQGEHVAIDLSATDANNDTRTYAVQTAAGNGSGSFTSTTGASTTYNYTPNPNFAGTDSITFRVDDGFGGSQTKTVAINVSPSAVIDSGPSGASNDDDPAFTFSSTASGVTFECRLDGGTYVPCASPTSFIDVADGSHTFEVRAIKDSLVDPTPASRAFTIDTAEPETTIDSGPAEGSLQGSQSATLEFSSSEPGSTFECRLDGGAWEACASPAELNGLDDGEHTFEVRAVDEAGNSDGTPATRTFSVDATAPETSIDSGPADGAVRNVDAATFEFSADEAGATFECQLDGDGWSDCASPAELSGLSDGEHTFEVRALDGLGNADPTPAARTFTVDTTAPDTTIDSGPADGSVVGVNSATFEFSADETGSTFECRLDGGGWSHCESPAELSNLEDGEHTFEVRATDEAGNTDGTPASSTFTVETDTAAPTTTDDVPAEWRRDDVTVTLSADDGDGSGIDATYYETGTDPADPTTSSSVYDPANKPVLGNGERIKYFSVDNAGNQETVKTSAAARVDKQAPVTTDDVPAGWRQEDVRVVLSVTETGGSNLAATYYEVGVNPPDPTVDSPLYDPDNRPVLGDGERIKYFSVDVAGNAEAIKTSAAAKVDGSAPVTSDDVPAAWQRDDVAVTLSAADTGSGIDATYYETGTDPADPTTSSSVYDPANKPVLGNGERIKYFSVDVAGNAEDVKTSAAAKVDGDAPTTTDDVPAGWGNEDVTVTLSAADTGGSGIDATYYETGTDPADPTTSSEVYDPADKPVLADGERIRYFSVDVAGNAEAVKASAAAKVDKGAPSTTDDVPAGWRESDVAVTLTAADTGGSGIDATYYETGTDPADPTTGSDVYDPADKPVLGHGERIKYFSVDVAGNAEDVRTSPAAQVDGAAPSTSDDVPAAWQRDDVTVTLSAFDGRSGVAATYYEVGTDPADPTTSSEVYDPADKPVLGDGERIKYFSVDVAGNADPVKASSAARVDKGIPSTTDDVPAAWRKNDVAVTLTPSDTGGSGIDATYYETGTDPVDPTTSSDVYDPADKPVLGDGERIKYFSVDVAGNAEAVKTSAAAKVDDETPSTSDDVPAAWQKGDVTVTLTASDTGGSGIDATYYETGADPADPTTDSDVYDPADKPVLGDGERIKYFSVDVAGNAEAVKTSPAAKVDEDAPVTTDDVPASGWQRADVTVHLSAIDSGGSDVEATYYEVGTDPADPTTSSPVYDPDSPPVLGHGERIRYFSVDVAGNAEAVKSSPVVQVDEGAPATADDVPAGWQGSDVTVTLTATDDRSGVDTTYYETGTDPADPTTSSDVYDPADKPVLGHGERIKYFSVDVAGNAEGVRTSIAAQVDGQAPNTSDDVPSAWQKDDVTVTLTAGDARSGVAATYYETGTDPADPTTDSDVYDPASKPVLGDGERIRYFSVDVAGNAEAVRTSPAAKVDKQAPETSDDVPAAWQKEDVTVTLTAADSGGSEVDRTYYEVGTDPADPTTSSEVYDPADKPVLGDGERITYFSVDVAGNAETVKTSPAAKVDKAAPSTADDVPGAWQPGPVSVTLTAADTGGSGIDATYYETGADPADPTMSSDVYDPANKPVLGDGERIKYFSVDVAGNAEAVRTSPAARVDAEAPSTSDDVPSGWRNDDVTVTLTATDSGSGVAATHYETGANPADPTTSSPVYDPANKPVLGDGERIKYLSVDELGNAEVVRTSPAAKVDKQAPVTTDDVPAARQGKLVKVTLTATDAGGSGVATTYYETGVDPAAPSTSSAVYDPANKPELGDGERIRYFTVDGAGNAEEPKLSGPASVDIVAPDTTITSGRGVVTTSSVTLTFTSNEGSSSFECSLNGGPFRTCTSPKTYTNLPDGNHTFAVRAYDEFGHLDPTPATRDFVVRTVKPDTTKPDTEITSVVPKKVTEGERVTLTFAASEPAKFRCRFDRKPWRNCSSPYTSKKLERGKHRIMVAAVDKAGLVDPTPARVKVKAVKAK